VLTYLTVAGTGLISLGSNFSKALNLFIFDIALGQSMALNLVFGALLATGALLVRKVKNTVYLVALGAAALVPLAVSGHASGTADHADAVNSTGLHLVAIVLWVGGLVGLLVMQVGATSQLKVALLRRYSALALFAFVLTAFSGVAATLVRTQIQFLFTTSYGIIVVAKIVTLVIPVFPNPGQHRNKYWPIVRRIDSVYGDRNLVCSCPPIEAFAN
jgi:putative copper resistance protein D